MRSQHCRSAVQRSQHVDRADVQVDQIPVRTHQSPRLHLECQGILSIDLLTFNYTNINGYVGAVFI